MALSQDPSSSADRPTGNPPSVKRIRHRLALLRVRMRAILGTIAASRWLLGALGVLVVYFVADWFLDLPLGVRRFARLGLIDQPDGLALILWLPLLLVSGALAVVLTRARRAMAPVLAFVAAGVLGLLVWLAVRSARPLGRRMRDADLALAFERRFAHLQDRLASALDFERELAAPQRGESPEMMRAVVGEAVEAARELSVAQAAPARRARRWSFAAIGGLAVAGVLVALMPDTWSLWARRSLLLEDVQWPQETTLVAVQRLEDGSLRALDPSQRIEVSQGRPLTITALAEGVVPSEVFLVDVVHGQQPLPRRMFQVAGSENLFSYEFRDVRRDFQFSLRGGDDQDGLPVYAVAVTVPPRVLGMRTTITAPAYLGLEPEQVPSGSFTAPEGAQVDVRFQTDIEIETAEILFGDERIRAVPDREAQETAGANRAFRFGLVANRAGTYRVLLTTATGRTNDGAGDTYEVRIARDRAPQAIWTWPRGTVQATPAGRLPLLGRAVDDHGVSRLFLEVRTDAEHSTWFDLRPADGSEGLLPDAPTPELDPELAGARRLATTDGALGRKEIKSYYALELSSLRDETGEAIKAGSRISLRLVAFDSRGQRREGEWSYVDLYAPDDFERDLVARRISVRGEIETVFSEQQVRLEELRGIDGLASAEERANTLKSIRFAQAKITQDADRAMRNLGRIFDAFVLNRLGAPQPTTRILAIYDAHHRKTYGTLPSTSGERTEAGADRGRGNTDWRGDPVFPYALYGRVAEAWRNKAFLDRGLLDRMLEVLDDAVKVGSRLAPEAQVAAARATTGNADDITMAQTALGAHAKALEDLLRAMKNWKGLQDVVLAIRQRIDEQRALIPEITSSDSGNAAEGDD